MNSKANCTLATNERVQERSAILDSSLISPTFYSKGKSQYDIKLIDLGDYMQVYVFDKTKTKVSEDKKDFDLNLSKSKKIELEQKNDTPKINDKIELKNIMRSKLSCQRLAKANINDWQTFITLTFKDNIQDVKYANKRFRYFIDKIRRVKKDFKYLCITEFQKRGATHYHLLTNISINDTKLMYHQEDNPKYKHIKYWLDGFTSVEEIKGDAKKIVGYISKYMTKDIDNRLFSHHRYLYSQNLKLPITNYIDTSDEKHLTFFQNKIQDKQLIYNNNYYSNYDNSLITFLEYSKKTS